MQLLSWLSVGYAVILVLALGASLTAIWISLWRIGSALAEVRYALETARHETALLGEYLEPVGAAVDASAAALQQAHSSVRRVNERLHHVAERAGAIEPAR